MARPCAVGSPQPLFETDLDMNAAVPTGYSYDVTADGQRFLVASDSGDARRSPLTVVVNWTAALKR